MSYSTRLTWSGNRGSGTSAYTSYGREFHAGIDGKPDIDGSADPAFRGDGQKHNPEDLLLVAVAACHMLTYLALCARNGIRVVDYSDDASGVMNGKQFEEITLHPIVTIASDSDADRAAGLHDAAHESCFIANSCNFPIHHRAEIRS